MAACDVWPNITGEITIGGIGEWDKAIGSGALYKTKRVNDWGTYNSSYGHGGFGINASSSSALYSGSTFQPRAGLTLLCIKI